MLNRMRKNAEGKRALESSKFFKLKKYPKDISLKNPPPYKPLSNTYPIHKVGQTGIKNWQGIIVSLKK